MNITLRNYKMPPFVQEHSKPFYLHSNALWIQNVCFVFLFLRCFTDNISINMTTYFEELHHHFVRLFPLSLVLILILQNINNLIHFIEISVFHNLVSSLWPLGFHSLLLHYAVGNNKSVDKSCSAIGAVHVRGCKQREWNGLLMYDSTFSIDIHIFTVRGWMLFVFLFLHFFSFLLFINSLASASW